MSQILSIIEDHLILALVAMGVLLVVTLLVGSRAKPNENLVKKESGVRQPFSALSKDPTAGPDIFKNWGSEETKKGLKGALKWDFSFLALYPLSTSLACLLLTPLMMRHLGVPLTLTKVVVSLQFLGAFVDIIENIGLWSIINGHTGDSWLRVLPWCSVLKFVFPAIGVVYVVVGIGTLLYVLVGRRSSSA